MRRNRSATLILGVSLVLAACYPQDTTAVLGSGGRLGQLGRRVATLRLRPFDPNHVLPNTQVGSALAKARPPELLHARGGNSDPNSAQFGTTIKPLDTGSVLGNWGVGAIHQVFPWLALPADGTPRTLYGPTLKPPNYAPLESVTAYWKDNVGDPMGRMWAVWDHSLPNNATSHWVYGETIDETFLAKYTENFGPDLYYHTLVYRLDGVWRVYIYNMKQGWWEEKASSKGIGDRNDGWDIFEGHFQGFNPRLRKMRCQDLSLWSNNFWNPINFQFGEELRKNTREYYCDWNKQFADWQCGSY